MGTINWTRVLLGGSSERRGLGEGLGSRNDGGGPTDGRSGAQIIIFTKVLALFALVLSGLAMAAERPIPVKVAVVAMFERGADTGDQPGEFQY